MSNHSLSEQQRKLMEHGMKRYASVSNGSDAYRIARLANRGFVKRLSITNGTVLFKTTELGKAVYNGEITNSKEAFRRFRFDGGKQTGRVC